MISRYAGSCLGLFAFSVAVVSGLFSGNEFSTIISRALLAMFLFFVIGTFLGIAVQKVIDEQMRAKERDLEAAGVGGSESEETVHEEKPKS